MLAFARSAQVRKSTGDRRLSLGERHGSHVGYVGAVRKAAERTLAESFFLPDVASEILKAAQHSAVLQQ